jgi:L-lactate dehydrogenase complex protein LldF
MPRARRSGTRSCVTTSVSRRTRSAPKRHAVVSEVDDWEALREAGKRIKESALGNLDVHLERLEASVTAASGTVHWGP